jgi:hypothetical protein
VIDISSAKWIPLRLNKTGQNRSLAALRNSQPDFKHQSHLLPKSLEAIRPVT